VIRHMIGVQELIPVILKQSECHVTWVRQSKVNKYGSHLVVLQNKLH